MVDTSRHYQTLTILYQLLDSMSFAKLNVLHWHVVVSVVYVNHETPLQPRI